MAGENKRRHPRRPMYRVVRYAIEGREYADLSTNVSERGIFIKNFSPPPVGTRVELTVKGPQLAQPFRLVGRVAHVNLDDDPHKRGMGVEFLAVVADSRPLIEGFVREVFRQDELHEASLSRRPDGASGRTVFQYLVKPGEGESS